MCSGGHVVDAAIPGKLIGFLPVLASALSVALARDRPKPAEWPADLAERQCEVEIRQRVVDALRLLLRPRAVSTIAVAPGQAVRCRRRSASGTPVICSTRSGQ